MAEFSCLNSAIIGLCLWVVWFNDDDIWDQSGKNKASQSYEMLLFYRLYN